MNFYNVNFSHRPGTLPLTHRGVHVTMKVWTVVILEVEQRCKATESMVR